VGRVEAPAVSGLWGSVLKMTPVYISNA